MINAPVNLRLTGPPKGNTVYELDRQDLELLSRFQARTVLTIGTAQASHIYQKEVIELACAVSTSSSRSTSNSDFGGLESILDARGPDLDTDA